jgi:AbrB family looped-hinge helix DNA binding protein
VLDWQTVSGGESRGRKGGGAWCKNGLENEAADNNVTRMRTILDKAGRILIPVGVRQKLRLKAGTVFNVVIVGDKIELEQEVPKVRCSLTPKASTTCSSSRS